jgi:hypothetical protein
LAVRLELDWWKISRGTLSKIEAGIRQVTDIEVMVLARTLKVAPEWLLDKQLFESLLKKLRSLNLACTKQYQAGTKRTITKRNNHHHKVSYFRMRDII